MTSHDDITAVRKQTMSTVHHLNDQGKVACGGQGLCRATVTRKDRVNCPACIATWPVVHYSNRSRVETVCGAHRAPKQDASLRITSIPATVTCPACIAWWARTTRDRTEQRHDRTWREAGCPDLSAEDTSTSTYAILDDDAFGGPQLYGTPRTSGELAFLVVRHAPTTTASTRRLWCHTTVWEELARECPASGIAYPYLRIGDLALLAGTAVFVPPEESEHELGPGEWELEEDGKIIGRGRIEVSGQPRLNIDQCVDLRIDQRLDFAVPEDMIREAPANPVAVISAAIHAAELAEAPGAAAAPEACQHEHTEAAVAVYRLTDIDGGPVAGYSADIRIRCRACLRPFRFIGVPAGSSPSHPMASILGDELRVPIEPLSGTAPSGADLAALVEPWPEP